MPVGRCSRRATPVDTSRKEFVIRVSYPEPLPAIRISSAAVFFLLDVQYFYCDRGYIIPKEVALSSHDGMLRRSWLLKPPFLFHELQPSTKARNIFQRNHVHGIAWRMGVDDLEDVRKEIKHMTDGRYIFSWGENQKIESLTTLLGRPVRPVSDVGVVSDVSVAEELMSTKFDCFHESFTGFSYPACALRNCVVMAPVVYGYIHHNNLNKTNKE